MAFDEDNAQRIRTFLQYKEADFFEKKMFGGLVFMVDNKMCCGTRLDKQTGENLLLCRIDDNAYADAIERDDIIPMSSPERPMKNYIFVTENGWQRNKDLEFWLQLCLDFNPLAKASKKK
ncbi:TfoX/Sxy family protein [Flavobacterium sp. ov086]|uniref:TfoX/Sxy family protein n=1 Tax=Flavobacterium sp. ov086 TaxID=1761785 RepID=UPI000B6DC70C|nr:TfoX/Sxy family protein [Flavobacterium sp. ov086]SNR98538.1 TfoX N-terminal domain-containing protein [Flavobacterium sp. ov086]